MIVAIITRSLVNQFFFAFVAVEPSSPSSTSPSSPSSRLFHLRRSHRLHHRRLLHLHRHRRIHLRRHLHLSHLILIIVSIFIRSIYSQPILLHLRRRHHLHRQVVFIFDSTFFTVESSTSSPSSRLLHLRRHLHLSELILIIGPGRCSATQEPGGSSAYSSAA